MASSRHFRVMLLLTLAAATSIYLVEAHWNAREVLDITHSSSHLPAVERASERPYPYSETYMSFEETRPRPCQNARREPYRRADAACNNLRNPFQGASLDTQRRLFSNSYRDRRSIPTINSVGGGRLPSARSVSVACFASEEDEDGNGQSEVATQMVWQFGQLLAHDITHLEKVDGFNKCCDRFRRDFPAADLFTRDYQDCFPMEIPENDPFFNNSCMVFARTYAADVLGVREPINAVTSYIDASTIYGSSQYLQNELREFVGGRMKTITDEGVEQLPRFGTYPCTKSPRVPRCPVGGDIRVSDQPALGAMHTMFHLEHNRIAQQLFSYNIFWDDERLFQEARKIVIGIFQKIVYEDFLPVLVGNDVMRVFNLDGDYTYDDSVDAGAILDFTTSGLRFGHTLLNTFVGEEMLRDLFLEPINGETLTEFPFFQASHRAHVFNNLFTNEIRQHLFEGVEVENFSAHPGTSFDLTALNIQRARDHGITHYTAVRDYCIDLMGGVQGVFNTTPACAAEVYSDPRDIELFVGGVSEEALPNAVLGATFACMAGIQFQRLKFGDRFFYQGSGLEGFTDDQRTFIRRTTLAAVICELDDKQEIQRDVFRPTSASNPRVPCATILEERDLQNGLLHWVDTSEDTEIRQQIRDSNECL